MQHLIHLINKMEKVLLYELQKLMLNLLMFFILQIICSTFSMFFYKV